MFEKIATWVVVGFLLFFASVCIEVKKGESTPEALFISTAFINNPNDFTVIYSNDEGKVFQKRFQNVEIQLCDNCKAHLINTPTFDLNIYGGEVNFSNKAVLYLPSLTMIEGGEAYISKNNSNKVHKVYGGK